MMVGLGNDFSCARMACVQKKSVASRRIQGVLGLCFGTMPCYRTRCDKCHPTLVTDSTRMGAGLERFCDCS